MRKKVKLTIDGAFLNVGLKRVKCILECTEHVGQHVQMATAYALAMHDFKQSMEKENAE